MTVTFCIITALACLAIIADAMRRLQEIDAPRAPADAITSLIICLGAFVQLILIWPMHQLPSPGASLVLIGLAANILRSIRRRAARS